MKEYYNSSQLFLQAGSSRIKVIVNYIVLVLLLLPCSDVNIELASAAAAAAAAAKKIIFCSVKAVMCMSKILWNYKAMCYKRS